METLELPLDEIIESPEAVRYADDGSLEFLQLMDSMRELKLIHPIQVRRFRGKYAIISGNRRFAAARRLGWDTITVTVADRTEEQNLIAEFVANASAKQFTPIQVAKALRMILSADPDLTLTALSAKVYQSVSWVRNQLNLLKLPPKVRARVDSGEISILNGMVLSTIPVNLIDRYVDDAAQMGTKEFRMFIASLRRSYQYRQGTDRIRDDFQPQASVKSLKFLKSALDNDELLDKLVVEGEPVDLRNAVRLGIAFCLNLDPVSVHNQRASYERARMKEREARARDQELIQRKMDRQMDRERNL